MMTQNMTMTYASANGTTSASRAHSAAMSCTSKNHIALILDAILLASIIICALESITILVSVFVAGISILVLVLLVLEYCDSPRLR
ncbi:hypothetical protein [uncultured Oscillibacter sp.]|uniref:hypothetical protein n=1 Tax=uncultured Oscillibacter sp. TaxID=876091 RepID=UPI001F86D43F|nr:hypothetical protein [uncultured Oscillibacter sp.]HJB76992.1 hypothetical protein [Candidatus Oscillibacter avistercoris]